MPSCHRRERLIRTLHDALRPDINPRASRHLSIHGEARAFQPSKLIPIGPAPHQVAVGNQHTRRVLVCGEHRHRLATLHEQRLVVGQRGQGAHNRVKGLPRPCRASGATVHHEIIGPFRNVRIEIVHQHPECRFLLPATAL